MSTIRPGLVIVSQRGYLCFLVPPRCASTSCLCRPLGLVYRCGAGLCCITNDVSNLPSCIPPSQCRAALMVMIYRKSLRLSYIKGGVGDIVNLISNDQALPNKSPVTLAVSVNLRASGTSLKSSVLRQMAMILQTQQKKS